MKQKLLTDIELDVHGLKYLMDLYSKEPAKAVLELLKQNILHMQGCLDEVLQELEMNNSLGTPKAVMDKSWMDFDNSLPVMPKAPEKKVVLTLRPYTANTKYNWDPIYQKKIKVDKDTWRGDEFYALKILMIPTNWAKHPFDAGPRETVEQIEATGLRYRVTERANNMAVGRVPVAVEFPV